MRMEQDVTGTGKIDRDEGRYGVEQQGKDVPKFVVDSEKLVIDGIGKERLFSFR